VGAVTTTVADLLAMADLSLTLVAGKDRVGRPIRWAHVSELEAFSRGLLGPVRDYDRRQHGDLV
jgi:hypothetical protein